MAYSVFVMPKAHARLEAHVGFLARVSENAAVRLFDSYKESMYPLTGYRER